MTTLICQPIKEVKPCAKCGGVERTKKRECKKCHADRRNNWGKKNPHHAIKWKKENPYSSAMVKREINQLITYRKANLSASDIPPELVEIKRLQMQLHHAIKEKQLIGV